METVIKVLELMAEAKTSTLTTAVGWFTGSLGMSAILLHLVDRVRRLERKVSGGNAGDGVRR